MLDYESLKLIWWLFVGILLIGFAITDGFDMGIGTLLPFVARNDTERRIVINAIGATWEGNQVWFITAGGAIFAALPIVYAVAFSGFYIALLLVLFALFLRPVGFDYRSKIKHPYWRSTWDWGLFIGGTVPAIVFGVAFGNLLQGVPFYFDDELRAFYTGSFWQLLNPFALLAGIVSFSMLVMHGAIYLQIRTEGAIYERSQRATWLFGWLFIGSFALAGLWLIFGIQGYQVLTMPATDALPNPLAKTVAMQAGAWLNNYGTYPLTLLAPISAFAGVGLAMRFAQRQQLKRAFVSSSVMLAGVIMTAGCAMFPFIMPSSVNPNHSLIIWDSVSSHLTLLIMFYATLIFLPLIVFYTSWVYRVLRGKITEQHIEAHQHSAY
ncbi:cytochrome d oxidase cyd, subunit II [Beggiatoa alba B18LD]|uniref:Cytochrome d oxidase cyd, subunit II n=1 Tax=Beggiatoa alba B18LD TaxID=395493 RepID=I3CKS0_9GAMM|nr:cytochrome d ubiquinol oxidase subunit II [Beggiatoa alba]EIJ44213.1 cytochrome d oxidase cyd, subunit II [Beggiatoa alba B18LD]